MTIDFYDNHSDDFVRETQSLDMSRLYEHFLPLVPAGGRILDAGCGPGRDARAFVDRGFAVQAIDASARMVELATARLDEPAVQMRFQDVVYEEEFDGVWACASLLHVMSDELPDAVQRLSRALVPGGAFHMSFKKGEGETLRNGRHFNDQTQASLESVLVLVPRLEIHEMWEEADSRVERKHLRWVHCVARRRSE